MARKSSSNEKGCCPHCKASLPEAFTAICKVCQTAIAYCPKCKKLLPLGSRVCPNCGTKVT
ncbi:MAG: zinc ribbon domain-containing protein [Chloroflexota bacterium]